MADKHIGNYRILRQIGVGGMAKVYLAVHKDVPNLKVVLKILTSPQHAERFMQEADKLALLDGNPNICQIRHFFTHEDELVIAMEYIEGVSLDDILEEKGRLPVGEALRMVIDLLTALAPAHEKEIYHRDIKPSNVMFEKSGRLKIIDFGIAKGKTDPQMTIVGTAAGTPAFMAPEQFAAGVDVDYSKCDIYAVGTILYRMLTGEMPFKGDNEFVLRDAKMSEDPPRPSDLAPEIPRELDDVILKAIHRHPGERFATIEEMKSALRQVLEGPAAGAKETVVDIPAAGVTPTGAGPAAGGRPGRAAARRGRSAGGGKPLRALGLAAAVVVVVAAVVMGIRVFGGNGAREETGADTVPAVGAGSALPEQGAGETDGGSPAADRRVSGGDAAKEDRGGSSDGEGGSAASAGDGGVSPTREQPPPPPPGFLLVTSRPGHAEVYINGDLQQEPTPFRFQRPPGRYTVRMVREVEGRMLEHSVTVEVRSGEMTKVSHNFEG